MAIIFNFDARKGLLKDTVSGKVPTVTGSPKVMNGKYGRYLNTKLSYITYSGTNTLTNTGAFSVLCAGKITDNVGSDIGGFISKLSQSAGYSAWGIVQENVSTLRIGIGDNTTTFISVYNKTYKNDTDFWLLFTYDGINTIKIYENGLLVGTSTYTILSNSNDISIGRYYSSSHGNYACSSVYFASIYNEILSAEKIQKLYNEFINSGNNVSVLRPKQKIQHIDDKLPSCIEFMADTTLTLDSAVPAGTTITEVNGATPQASTAVTGITSMSNSSNVVYKFETFVTSGLNMTSLIGNSERNSAVSTQKITVTAGERYKITYSCAGTIPASTSNRQIKFQGDTQGTGDTYSNVSSFEAGNNLSIILTITATSSNGYLLLSTVTGAVNFSFNIHSIEKVGYAIDGTTIHVPYPYLLVKKLYQLKLSTGSEYYPTDNARVYDKSVNANHLTVNGTLWTTYSFTNKLILFHNYENGNALDLVGNNNGTPTGIDYGRDGANAKETAPSYISVTKDISTIGYDWSIECFYKPLNTSIATAHFITELGVYNTTGCAINQHGDILYIYYKAGAPAITLNSFFKAGKEYFITLAKSETLITCNINGITVGTITVANDTMSGTGLGILGARIGTAYTCHGSLKFFKLYNYARTLAQHKADYNRYAKQLSFNEDMKNLNAENITYSAGSILPNGWKVESGSVKVIEKAKALTQELVTNGTFIDSNADGLADGWNISIAADYSIVTGNGHIGNAQRWSCQAGQINRILYSFRLSQYKCYKLTFEYRAKNAWLIGEQFSPELIIPANNGNAITYNIYRYAQGTGNPVRFIALSSEDWVEISNLSVTEVQDIPEGTKIIEQVTAGITSIPCNIAYGTFECDMFKGADGNTSNISFISGSPTISTSYKIILTDTERIAWYKDSTPLGYSLGAYIKNGHWYKIRITRTTAGVFTVYIKSPTDTNFVNWTLVVAGGSGTNPVTDNTYTTSNFIAIDNDAGDKIANIKWYQGVEK